MKPQEYIEAVLKTESNDWDAIRRRLMLTNSMRLLHGVSGIVTEAGELEDILKKWIFYGKDVDSIHVKEELGDLLWYVSILMDVFGFTYEGVWKVNIDKLKARYGDKFGETGALTRDLEKERAILEQSGPEPHQREYWLGKTDETIR